MNTLNTNADLTKLEFNINDIAKVWDGVVTIESIKIDGKDFTPVNLKKKTHPNKVLVGGLIKTIQWLYKLSPSTRIDFFEKDLYVGAEHDDLSEGNLVADTSKMQVDAIMGFNVALDGALGGETLPYPRHKKGYDFDNLIPFRMIHISEKSALFDNLRQKYLHHRIITHDGEQYIQFFTKKTSFRVSVELDDGNEVPTNPDTNLSTNLDSSGNAVFTVLTDKDELVEFFQLMKAGGGESTCFSATMTMMGKPAKYTDPDTRKTYDAMHETVVYSRANHPNLPKGVKGIIEVTYNIKHI